MPEQSNEEFMDALSAFQIPPGMPNSQALKQELIRRAKTSASTRDGSAEVLLQILAGSQLEVLHLLAITATEGTDT